MESISEIVEEMRKSGISEKIIAEYATSLIEARNIGIVLQEAYKVMGLNV